MATEIPETNLLNTTVTGTAVAMEELTSKRVAISPSEGFTFEDVGKFLAAQPGTVVTLIGDRDSGKSTLLCAIYDRFLHGPFADRQSAGVRTITALERRAHLERVESGRDIPDTQHTSLAEGLQYFHFAACKDDDLAGRESLLISDRAGETYKNARANTSLVDTLLELPHADYLVLLLDGARIANPTNRAGAMFAVRQTLQMLTDHKSMSLNDRVQIVLSKIDLVDAATDVAHAKQQVTEFMDRIRRDFARKFTTLEYFEIAARALGDKYAPATGVDLLFKSWFRGPKARSVISAHPLGLSAEFDKLEQRTLPSEVAL